MQKKDENVLVDKYASMHYDSRGSANKGAEQH